MRKLIALLLLSISIAAPAKLTQFIARGYVEKQDYSKSDWHRESLDSVYVALVQNDTIPVDFKMLTGDDELKMTTTSELRLLVQGGVGEYSLILNRDGYEPLRHDFKIVSEGQDVVYLRRLSMEARRENALNEVEVLGTAIKMVMKGDTIVYDSRAFKLAEGSTLDALVRQLPGAQLADDGSITVNGKKVSSLLLNGNDFFQGDPDVALKNLPAYTVDKIKVYDKAAKDDQVTLASHTLSDSPENENLVMDVQLKKEFAMATILSVEGGYGPGIYPKDNPKRFDNRYLGRAFLIGFGKNYRFSAFGNYNNLRNRQKASSRDKNWGWSWNPNNGETKVAMGGFDVFYNPTKKLEVSADVTYTREDNEEESINSETRFYPTGNLYQRSRSLTSGRSDNIEAHASLRYSGDQVNFFFNPKVEWERSNSWGYNMSATFNRNPVEQSRGAAIDSLFNNPSASLLESVTTASYNASNNNPSYDRLKFGGMFGVTWRPKNIRGYFTLSASGIDNQYNNLNGNLIYQSIVSDPNANPVRRQQWSDADNRSTTFGTNIDYTWNKKHITERRIQSFEFATAVGYDLSRSRSDRQITAAAYLAGLNPGERPLPSVTAPENIRPLVSFDGNNSVNTLDLSNEAMGRVRLNYSLEPAAPGDSCFNPRFNFNATFTHRQYWRHYTYAKPRLEPEPLRFVKNLCEPTEEFNTGLGLSTSNKLYYFSTYLGYSFQTSLSSLSVLVPTMNNENPLQVYLGPENGDMFPAPRNHNAYMHGYWYGNHSHRSFNYYISYRSSERQTANSSVYDPATGITTHRPITVNGNWNAYANAGYNMPFGPQECWQWGVNVSYSFNNSVDYISAIGAPQRSVVKTGDLNGRLSISYKLKNGTRFGLNGGTTWQNSTSPRTDFSEINAWKTQITASINFYLPWQIEGSTELRADIRNGYEDPVLNTTEWIWNAAVQKSLLKGALTFKLQAVDILGQLSNTYYWVNAQGRSEAWTNTLPRYVMLTVAYKFNFTPKALQ